MQTTESKAYRAGFEAGYFGRANEAPTFGTREGDAFHDGKADGLAKRRWHLTREEEEADEAQARRLRASFASIDQRRGRQA
jgi:hypothetical protein